MRRIATRIAAGLAALAATAALTPSPAAAADPSPFPDDVLVFFVNPPFRIVETLDAPDGLCRPFPAAATSLIAGAKSGFSNVIAYRSADCSGQPFGLGLFRGISPAGSWGSYQAI